MGGYYPIMLNLQGKRCVIVGGGEIAERKLRGLLAAGADQIVVIAPKATRYIEEMAGLNIIELAAREYKEEDAHGALVLFAATNNKRLNETIAADGRRGGALVQLADEGESGDFITPSVVRRGNLLLAVTASGASPALSRLIRLELEQQYGNCYAVWTDRLGQLRKLAYETLRDEDGELVYALLREAAAEAAEAAKGERNGCAGIGNTNQFDIGEWLAALLHRIDRRHF